MTHPEQRSDGSCDAPVVTQRTDPRAVMAHRLPACVQPLLTWLTARPAPGERPRQRATWTYPIEAALWTIVGVLTGALAFAADTWLAWVLLPASLVATTSGIGQFQILVFHRCAHGNLFTERLWNRRVGRLTSAMLLFKHFDAYQREHMLHHNFRKLLTEEDEFADFLLGMLRLKPQLSKAELWRRVLLGVASPVFHLRFLAKRVQASWLSPDRLHNAVGFGAWLVATVTCAWAGVLGQFLLLWVLPVSVLLQLATVGRVLIEHSFPAPEVIAARGKPFICHATAGVVAGSVPPNARAESVHGFMAWTAWWADMLTVQLLARVVVLVGDAPCHDFHHRRPSSDRWTDYIHARQEDVDAGCPGFPVNYHDQWGLVHAIDENLATLARTPHEALRPATATA
jgi:fatty acid desaturase